MNAYQKIQTIVYLVVLLSLCTFTHRAGAQAVSINEGGVPPNAKSILDVSSTEKGMLIPRMTTVERNAINAGNTESGMLVYDTDIERFMYFNGSLWLKLGEGLWSEDTTGIYRDGTVAIGIAQGAAGYQLSVNGKIMCEELKVQNSDAWPDYVFAPDYPLLSLTALESHIQTQQHLPGMPSAAQVDKEGIEVGNIQRRMLEKIEELTLYIIAQDKRIAALEKTLAAQHP